MDTQPWFILMAIVLCMLSVKVKGDSLLVVCAVLFAVAAVTSGIARTNVLDFIFFRGILSYVAFSSVLLGYYFYRKKFGFPRRIFVAANLIWLAVGIAQLTLGPDLLDAIVTVRTDVGRGVTGLSPEPTFYGMVLLFISWILLIESNYLPTARGWLLLFVNFCFMLLVAKSAMTLLFVFYLLFVYMLVGMASVKRFIFAMGMLVALVVTTVMLNRYYPEWRIVRVVSALSEDPLVAIRADASINERVSHLVFSFYGAIANNGLPGGFNTFGEFNTAARASFGDLFWYGGDSNKIMSGVGAVVYELGSLSIFFFAIVAFSTLSKRRVRIGVFHFVGFLGTFAAALPVAFPLAPMLLVSMLFWRRQSPPCISSTGQQALS